MPIAVWNGSRVAQVSGNRRTKLEEQAPYALVGNIQTSLRKKTLHIPIAQSEPGIEPNGVSNDVRWKAVTFEGDGVHPKRLHRNHQIEIRALNVTMPGSVSNRFLCGIFTAILSVPQIGIVLYSSSWWVQHFSEKRQSHYSCCRFWVLRFSGSLEFAHPIEEPSPVDVHTHTASAVDTDLVCAGEDPHENHNCLHVQRFNPALKLILALVNSPVFRPPTAGAIDNIRLFAVGIPPLRGPPLS